MDFIPLLIAEFTELAAVAGLTGLTIETTYNALRGWDFTAHGFRGRTALTLVPFYTAATESELRQALSDALLDQLAAYYVNTPQL